MITTRSELQRAIEADMARYRLRHPHVLGYFLADESYHVVKFLKALRHCEFYTNKQKRLLDYLPYFYYTYIHRRLMRKYGIYIAVNRCGTGIYIPHFRGGVFMRTVHTWVRITLYHPVAC